MTKGKKANSTPGQRGENEGFKIIKENAPEDARLYKNRVLGGAAENDLLMTSSQGFFDFEFKTWSGSTYGDGRNYRVTNVNSKTGQKQTFYNPCKQTESHNNVDKKVLGVDHTKLTTVIVDVNNSIHIKNPNCDIVTLDQLPEYMDGIKSKPTVVSRSNLYRVDKIIEEQDKESQNNHDEYVEKLKQKYNKH